MKKRTTLLMLGIGLVFFGAAWVVMAQDDLFDEDSLFAMEELALDDAVEGELPAGEDAGGDDMLGDMLGGGDDDFGFDDFFADDGEGDEFAFEEPLPEAGVDAEALLPEAGDDAFETVDAMAEPFDDFTEETEATQADDLFAEFEADSSWDADALMEEMESPEEEAAPAEADDLFADTEPAEPEASVDAATDDAAEMDDLFGEMLGGGDTGDDEDDWGGFFGDETAEENRPVEEVAVVEEKGVPLESEEDDFGMLLDELAMEEEDALAADEAMMATAEPQPMVADPAASEAAYSDDMALGDDFFASLAGEVDRADMTPPPALQPAADERRDRQSTSFQMEDDAPVFMDDASAMGWGDTPPAAQRPQMQGRPAPQSRPAQEARPTLQRARVATAQGPAARQPMGDAGSIASFEAAERLKRQAREDHAVNSLDRAEEALKERDYRTAIRMYQESLKHLPRRPDMERYRVEARQGLAGSYYLQAISLERMLELEAALEAAQDAARYGSRRAEPAIARIKQKLEDPPEREDRAPEHRWDEEDFKRIDQEIDDWLKRGREAYLSGEYERAVLAFESVLARDPENKEAIRMMRAAANKQYDRASMELDTTRTRMMAAVRDTWNPRQYGLHEEPIEADVELTTEREGNEMQRLQILQKMEQIRIPEIDFRQANIRDVVSFLQQQSVEFDPAPVQSDRTGVNIILKLDQNGAAAAEPMQANQQADFFAPPPAAGGFGGGAGTDPLVTFSALDVTLREALEIVVEIAGLKYRIRGNVVMVLPIDAPEGEIEHRMYDVLPSAITRLQELSSAVTSGNNRSGRGGAGDFLALDRGGDMGGEELDLKTFFMEMGVDWPARSSIKFVRGLGKLVVANTQENLTVFEKVLSILNVVPYQIEIEARFVEVAQTDVDALGLEWMLTDNWEMAEHSQDMNLPPAARRRIVMNANNNDGGFTSGNRFLTDAATGPLGENIMDQVASISSVLTNPELTVILHALQQRGHTDLLSAPKITTQSGQQATIKVVTEYIYPTAFETTGIGGDDNTLAGTGGGTVGAVVTPLDFTTREVGVILEVLPEVSPEGQMINLMLSPEVVSEPTWRNFGSTYTSFDPNGNPVEQVLNMEQPFFHTRKLRTNLLIYNGATVVMGGMITEVRNTVDDKIPLLGDIPVMGRLFRSQYDSSEKRNLLIFVTARLVDPAGRALDQERLGVDRSIAERIVTADE